MNTELEIKKIISGTLDIPIEDITLDKTLKDFNVTSLDQIDIAFQIDDKFQIMITDEELVDINIGNAKLEDLVKFVEKKIAEKNS